MGNITLGSAAAAVDGMVENVFESSLASDLQTRVQALVNLLITGGAGTIRDVNLCGAGDGHAFVCTLLVSPGGAPPAAGTVVRFYSGASEPAFSAAAAAAIASLQTQNLRVIGHGESGASQGTRWMGMIVAEPIPLP